jgi:tetratricopeptide (TPR) repeat protein
MQLERPEAESITALWFNNNADYARIIDWFLDDLCFLLREIGEEKWLTLYCRLALIHGCASPNYYSYQAEAYFKLREYLKVINAVGELEKKYQIKPYLEHLKCFSLWQTENIFECMKILRRRLENDPRDRLAALLAGDIFLSRTDMENALKSFVYAYHIEPGSIDILYSLSRAFHACYFTAQLDLCLKKAEEIEPGVSRRFKFGTELYIKCSKAGVRVRIDGRDAGDCPLCFKGIESGKRLIEWISAGGGHKRLEADLKDGYINIFKYMPEENKIQCDESREGRLTIHRDGEAIELNDLLKDYMAASLDSLPKPSIDDFIGAEKIKVFQ